MTSICLSFSDVVFYILTWRTLLVLGLVSSNCNNFFSIFNSKGATWSWDWVCRVPMLFVSSFYIQESLIQFGLRWLIFLPLFYWTTDLSYGILVTKVWSDFFLWYIKSLPAASHSYLCCLFRFILSLFCWRIGMHWVTGEFFKPAFIYCIFALLHQSPKTWSD